MQLKEAYDASVDFLRDRRKAYRLAFGHQKIVIRLRTAYWTVFGNIAGQLVLQDLARFCRANETTMLPGAEAATPETLEGRRQVWLRIQRHLSLTPEQLFKVYSQQQFHVEQSQGDDQNG
jgi:hypothetical protein